jgi:hypothetical protein
LKGGKPVTKYEVQVAVRYLKLQFEKGVGRSIAKIITELVTNADDSYKRMTPEEVSTNKNYGDIRIVANRRKKKFLVIDQAQGISKEEMKEKFVPYGEESGDRKAGWRTRSLFGKGLRDVLFTQKYGVVKSIKNNQSSIAEFYYGSTRGSKDKRPIIDIDDHPPKVNRDIRLSWGIDENGTCVEFRLREDLNFPRRETILEKLRRFYMLRMINSNPNRRVFLQYIDSNGEETIDQIKFSFPSGELIEKRSLDVSFDNRVFPTEIEIWRAENDLLQGTAGYEDREGGLLLIDEDDNVMDLTLFRYDNDPSASRLFGTVRIKGAGEYIRMKLNSDPPEEILTEDREGLVRRHGFYRKISEVVETILKPIIEDEERRRRLQSGGFSSETLARYNQAIDSLNALYQKLVGKADFTDGFAGKKPKLPEYLSFIRPELAITENVLTPIVLMINCDKFPTDSKVAVVSDNESISIRPETFLIARQSPESALLVKVLRINGCKAGIGGNIIAKAIDIEGFERSAELKISVVDKEVFYPPNGIAFKPSHVRLHEEAKRKLYLYLDVERIPTGSTIELACDSEAFELELTSIEFREEMKITEEVGCLEVTISARGNVGQHAQVVASSGSYSDKASVEIIKRSKEPETPKEGGRFKPPIFEPIPNLKVQTWLRSDGTILINTLDPLNKAYFGDNPVESVQGPTAKRHCQIRLADLVLDECLNQIVTDAWSKNTIEKRHPNNPEMDIRMYIAEWKYEYGQEIHKHFVTVQSDLPTS